MPYIPLAYLEDFLGFVARRRDAFEVLTYRDLDWGDDWDYAGGYPGEKRGWLEALKTGKRDPEKIYLFLQHDVDSVPERTMEALRIEDEVGLRSNVMIFNCRIDRRHYRETGQFRDTPYIEDRSQLKALQAKGFVIGYHCNAYERARFDRVRAGEIMLEDIEALRRDFTIDFMSAHGGPPGPDGKSNNSLAFPEALRRRVRWVHNGYSIHVDGGYSDGGINSGRRPPEKFDLRSFVQSLRPGRRYRILIHPQYYSADVEENPRLKSAWYDEALKAYLVEPRRSVWDNIALGTARWRHDERGWRGRVLRLVRRLSRHRNA